MKIVLSPKQLRLGIKISSSKQISDWLRACSLLALEEGYSVEEIASILQISHEEVMDYLKKNEKDPDIES